MEVDSKKFKEAIADFISTVRALETELLAYRFSIHIATESGMADPKIPWKAMVVAAKQNPATLKVMAEKYDPVLQELLTSVDLAELQGKVQELLKQWKPTGPIN